MTARSKSNADRFVDRQGSGNTTSERSSQRCILRLAARNRVRSRSTLLWLLGLSSLVVPLVLWPGSTEYGQAKIAVALTLVGVTWALFWSTKSRTAGLRVPFVCVGGVALLTAAAVSIIHASSFWVWAESFVPLAALLSLIVVVANVVEERRHVHGVLWGLSAAAAAASLYGLLQATGLLYTGESIWMPSFMGNSNYVGAFLAVVIPAMCILALFSSTSWRRWLAWALLAITWCAFPLLDHAGGLLALAVSFFAIGLVVLGTGSWRTLLRRRRGIGLVVAATVCGGLLASVFLGPGQAVFRASRTEAAGGAWQANSGLARGTNWRVGGRMLAQYPVFGTGLGDYAVEYVPALAALADAQPETKIPSHPMTRAHNDYIQAAAETGAIGIAAVVIALASLVVFAARKIRSVREDPEQLLEAALLLGGAISFAVLGLVSFPAHLVPSSWALVMLLGLLGTSAYGDRGVRSYAWGRSRAVSWGMVGVAVAATVLMSVYAWAGFRADLLLNQGVIQLQLGETEEAQRLLSRSISADPLPTEALYHRAMSSVQIGQQLAADGRTGEAHALYTQAAEDLERCQAVFPRLEVYLARANLGFVLDDEMLIRESLEVPLILTNPPSTYVQALYLRGLLAGRQGDIVAAEESFLQAIAVDDEYLRARIALAQLYRQLQLPSRAEQQYGIVLETAQTRLETLREEVESSDTISVERYAELTQQAHEANQAIELAEQGLREMIEP